MAAAQESHLTPAGGGLRNVPLGRGIPRKHFSLPTFSIFFMHTKVRAIKVPDNEGTDNGTLTLAAALRGGIPLPSAPRNVVCCRGANLGDVREIKEDRTAKTLLPASQISTRDI